MAMSSFNIRTNVEVHAEQLEEDRAIITPRGSENGQAGDWEVLFPDGNVQKMANEEWEEAQGKSDEEKQTEVSGEGISSAGNKGRATTEESADEDHADIGDEEDSAEETVTPEKPPRSSKTKVADDKF